MVACSDSLQRAQARSFNSLIAYQRFFSWLLAPVLPDLSHEGLKQFWKSAQRLLRRPRERRSLVGSPANALDQEWVGSPLQLGAQEALFELRKRRLSAAKPLQPSESGRTHAMSKVQRLKAGPDEYLTDKPIIHT